MFVDPPAGLVPGPVHVWRFASAAPDLLSDNERARARKFQSEAARDRFLTGRSGIRRAAAIYTGLDAREFVISQTPSGKPILENSDLHFNLSHSGGEVVAAFSAAPVGLDIESPGRSRDFAGIARRFFSPEEAAQISTEDGFLRIWTAKEAMLKLAGTGLAGGLAEARPGTGAGGSLSGRPIWIERFCTGLRIGAVASFQPFEVKGWFQL